MTTSIREPCDDGVIRSGLSPSPCPESSGKWVLAATILGSSLAFIDGTVVNVALPALQRDLGATVIGVQWVIEAYSLLLAALLLVGGSMGDRYGRRRIFVIGVTIFAAASAWCGFVSGIGQLITARAVQGIGAALLVPGSLAIISNSFPEEERGRAIGTWSGFSAITAAIGPMLGGWLVETVSWRAVFFINLPIAILVIIISLRYVPESSNPAEGRLDWFGAILATLGLGALVYGLIESPTRGVTTPRVLSALIGGIVLLSFFIFVEARSRDPMLPLPLFRSRPFAENRYEFSGARTGRSSIRDQQRCLASRWPPRHRRARNRHAPQLQSVSKWSSGEARYFGFRSAISQCSARQISRGRISGIS